MSDLTPHIYSPKEKQIKNYGNKELSVTINNKAIIPILADKIYKNPMSAIRELYNNEVTSCERIKKLYPNQEQPEIKLTYDSNTRELNIIGINSLGIDNKTFNEGLRVMGNSGNNDETMKGLWGLGFYSFVKISERIIITTKSRIENKDKAWICKSALSFEELQPDQYEKLDTYGTKLTLVLKDEVNENDLVSTINEICKLSGIKTNFVYDNELQDLTQYFKLQDYFESKFYDFFHEKYCSYSLAWTHIDHDDYEAFIFKTSGSFNSDLRDVYESYLLGTPIDLKFKTSAYSEGYDGVIVNVKNERKFEPKPDREQFEQASENELNDNLKFDAKKIYHYATYDPKIKTIHQWFNAKQRHFISSLNGKTPMDQNIKTLSYEDYRGSHTYHYMNRCLPVDKPDIFLVSKTFRKAGFANVKDHLLTIGKSVFCVAVKDTDSDYLELLKIGFKDFSEYIRENKIKVNVASGSSKTKKFVFHGRYNNFYDVCPNNSIVFKVKNINDHISTIRTIQNDGVYFITDNAQYKNAYTIEDIPKLIGFNKVFTTNRGLMTFKTFVTRSKMQKNTQIRFITNKFNHIGFHESDPEDEKGLTIVIKEGDKTQDLIAIYLREKAQKSFYSCYDSFSFYNYLVKRIKNPVLQKIISELIDKGDVHKQELDWFCEMDKLK